MLFPSPRGTRFAAVDRRRFGVGDVTTLDVLVLRADGEVFATDAVGAHVLPKRGERGFLDDVAELRAGVADRLASDGFEVDVVIEDDVTRVHAQGGDATLQIERRDLKGEIQSSGSRERRIEALRTVRRGDDEDAAAA